MLSAVGFVKTIGIDSENTIQVFLNLEQIPDSGQDVRVNGQTTWFALDLDENTRPKGVSMLRALYRAQQNKTMVILRLGNPEPCNWDTASVYYPVVEVRVVNASLLTDPFVTRPARSIMKLYDTGSVIQQPPGRLATTNSTALAG